LSRRSQPGHARSSIRGSAGGEAGGDDGAGDGSTEGGEDGDGDGSAEGGEEGTGAGAVSSGTGPGAAGGAGGALSLVPNDASEPPPEPAATVRWRSIGETRNDSCADGGRSRSPLPTPGPITTGPPAGPARLGGRTAPRLCSVAVPAATTIIVGTDVSATRIALINSGRRFG
jgi:hypothetical protein